MIRVKTFLQNPNVQYPGPEQVRQEEFTKYYFDIEDRKNDAEIIRLFEKGGNVYGCIRITFNKRSFWMMR